MKEMIRVDYWRKVAVKFSDRNARDNDGEEEQTRRKGRKSVAKSIL